MHRSLLTGGMQATVLTIIWQASVFLNCYQRRIADLHKTNVFRILLPYHSQYSDRECSITPLLARNERLI